MKRAISLFLALAICAVLCACGTEQIPPVDVDAKIQEAKAKIEMLDMRGAEEILNTLTPTTAEQTMAIGELYSVIKDAVYYEGTDFLTIEYVLGVKATSDITGECELDGYQYSTVGGQAEFGNPALYTISFSGSYGAPDPDIYQHYFENYIKLYYESIDIEKDYPQYWYKWAMDFGDNISYIYPEWAYMDKDGNIMAVYHTISSWSDEVDITILHTKD